MTRSTAFPPRPHPRSPPACRWRDRRRGFAWLIDACILLVIAMILWVVVLIIGFLTFGLGWFLLPVLGGHHDHGLCGGDNRRIEAGDARHAHARSRGHDAEGDAPPALMRRFMRCCST